jgi:hypothetical protein
MQYDGEAYCWQVAPQQSLIPLPLHGVNIQLSNAIVTNYFLQHYLFCTSSSFLNRSQLKLKHSGSSKRKQISFFFYFSMFATYPVTDTNTIVIII